MARMTMEVMILGTQLIDVQGSLYGKVFLAEEPDGETEQIASIQQMTIKEGFEKEVFASGAHFKLGQKVVLTCETGRGGKQSVKPEVVHIGAVEGRQRVEHQPQNKPAAEPAKG